MNKYKYIIPNRPNNGPTKRQNNQQTDKRVHREVTLQKIDSSYIQYAYKYLKTNRYQVLCI